MTFTKEKIIGLNGPQVHVFIDGQKECGFSIVADKQGIRFDGRSPYVESQQDLQALALAVGLAWDEHLALKPRLVTTPTGH